MSREVIPVMVDPHDLEYVVVLLVRDPGNPTPSALARHGRIIWALAETNKAGEEFVPEVHRFLDEIRRKYWHDNPYTYEIDFGDCAAHEALYPKKSPNMENLAASAQQLNEARNTLNRQLELFEEKLAQIRAGVSCWVPMDGNAKLGYQRQQHGVWGLCVYNGLQVQAIRNANTALRCMAVQYLPKLLEELVREADRTTAKVGKAVVAAGEILIARRSVESSE